MRFEPGHHYVSKYGQYTVLYVSGDRMGVRYDNTGREAILTVSTQSRIAKEVGPHGRPLPHVRRTRIESCAAARPVPPTSVPEPQPHPLDRRPPSTRPTSSTPVYHVTHVSNLPGIIAAGGLLSHALLAAQNRDPYVDISDSNIQAKRARKIIPCWEPCPTVDQFVPLSLRPCPLMLRQVALGRDVQYAGGLVPIVHLVFVAEDIHCAGIDYAISDRHPVSSLAQWGFSIESLHGMLDWQLILGPLRDKDDPGHSYQMAEFLVRDRLPWHLVREIAVMTDAARPPVTEALEAAQHRPTVSVRPEWYP